MKTSKQRFFAPVLGLVLVPGLAAAQFTSGSTGADGALNVTVNTNLTLPADGVFHFTTIHVASGKTLTISPNALNTPVVLLAQGNTTIGGTINLDGANNSGFTPGKGGPGGYGGGYGGFGEGINSIGGDGQGPGGGINGNLRQHAVYATKVYDNTNKYGNALISPTIGGSGGSGGNGNPGYGGGGGGGAILIASDTSITVTGWIYCRGGTGAGYGSGGAIRLVAPVVSGPGTLNVTSGATGSGRIRVDCEDRYAYRSLTTFGTFTRGAQMFVFPPVVPHLDIIEVASEIIPAGAPAPVEIELPIGSSSNRTVVVQGSGFTNNVVPITIAVIPENRPSVHYDTTIDMSLGDPAAVTNNVVIPPGTITRIQTWTR